VIRNVLQHGHRRYWVHGLLDNAYDIFIMGSQA
jgi:hypothetical protein